jgi:hypothetical protein
MSAIVATHKSDQETNITAALKVFLKPNEREGRVRISYFYTKPTAAVAATSIIALCRLPKGARIIGGVAKSNAFVATATADVGIISTNGDGVIDDAVPTADSATLLTAGGTLAVATAGDYPFANTIANNYGYVTQKDVTVILTLNTAGMDGSADILTGHVLYVVD